MKKVKEFANRVKRCWELSKTVRIIRNGATGIDELWMETSKEYNRGICESLHRIA